MTTNITADHRAAFEALVSGDYRNIALFSCFVNGEPAAAIAAVNKDGGNYAITPLFVSVTSLADAYRSRRATCRRGGALSAASGAPNAHRSPSASAAASARASAPVRRTVADGPG